jgi:hypothetical protein
VSVIAKFQCQSCRKNRTYVPKDLSQRRIVCMACRHKYPQTCRALLLEAAKYGKVEVMA